MATTTNLAKGSPPSIQSSQVNEGPSVCKKTLTLAMELILGGALVAGGAYYAYLHGVNTVTLYYIAGGGAVGVVGIAVTSCLCMSPRSKDTSDKKEGGLEKDENINSKKVAPTGQSRPAPKKVIQGKIHISAYDTGALGLNPTLATLNPTSQKVERVDGQSWRRPNEMMIKCYIPTTSDGKGPLGKCGYITLPFCLFTHDDDYSKAKTDGDSVTFIYEDAIYELTLAQKEYMNGETLENALLHCEKIYIRNQGVSQYDHTDTTNYLFPREQQIEERTQAQLNQEQSLLREKYKNDLEVLKNSRKINLSLTLVRPEEVISSQRIEFHISNVNTERMGTRITDCGQAFIFYAETNDGRLYLYLREFDATITKEKFESTEHLYSAKRGIFRITF